jgi:hypothetical protein
MVLVSNATLDNTGVLPLPTAEGARATCLYDLVDERLNGSIFSLEIGGFRR